jgi:hypothetical protein
MEPTQVTHFSSAPLLGRLLALLTNIRLGLKGLPGGKLSSLLHKFVNYVREKFYNIGPRTNPSLLLNYFCYIIKVITLSTIMNIKRGFN